MHRMIERLHESSGGVLGFKVVGKMTDEDIKGFEPQLEVLLRERKHKPIGILADLSEMHGAELKARWDEMRFLQKHTDHIARMAIVGADKWEEIMAILTAGASVLEAETRYFDKAQMLRRGSACAADLGRHGHLEGLSPGVDGPVGQGSGIRG
jgi:hypothetical protein